MRAITAAVGADAAIAAATAIAAAMAADTVTFVKYIISLQVLEAFVSSC